jgi:hypothetical protein
VLQALLEERFKAMQAHGFRMIAHQKFGSEGPVFVTNLGFQDMASLEASLDNNQQNPEFRAYTEKVQSMLARPSKTELLRCSYRSRGAELIGLSPIRFLILECWASVPWTACWT